MKRSHLENVYGHVWRMVCYCSLLVPLVPFFLGMFGLLFFLCVCVACRNDDERFLQTKEPLTEVCGLRMQTTQHMHKFCPQQS